MSSEKKPNVINKTFKVINAFVDGNSQWGVRDLAKYLCFPTSTLHRFLLQLQEEGILEFNETTNKYQIGMEMIRISSVIASKIDIKMIARPILEKLVERHEETICLIAYYKKRRKIVFIDKISGPDPLQYVINIGEPQQVPYGSSGKSILAFLEQEEIDEIIEQEQFSESKRIMLNQELKEIREKGFVTSVGDRIKGSKGIGVPIFNSFGYPIGSIVYTIPITRFNSSKEEEMIQDLKDAAAQISSIFGYVGGET